MHHIPQVVPLPTELKALREEESKEDLDEMDILTDREMHTRSTDFTYLRLILPEDEKVDYQVHKLAIILSTLAGNNYFPKTHSKQVEMVKVGIGAQQRNWKRASSPERVKLIPLLHFCYAVLCGEEERVFTLEDYNRIKEQNPIVQEFQPQKEKRGRPKPEKGLQEPFQKDVDFIGADNEPIFKVAQPSTQDEKLYSYYDQFSSYEEERLTRSIVEPHIGISPNIDGPFKPFVFYLKVRGIEMNENEYRWKTDEKGWAPGFNASFGYLTMDSYDPHDQSITVTKISARE